MVESSNWKSAATRNRRTGLPFISSLCFVLAAVSGCHDTSDLAPSAPDHPWHPAEQTGLKMPPGSDGFAAPASEQTRRKISQSLSRLDQIATEAGIPSAQQGTAPADNVIISGKKLSLSELIDIAERHNPQTRLSWEQARQNALAVGISEATLAPQITATLLAGGRRTVTAMPNFLTPKGYMAANAAAAFPEIQLSYLLFDFGHTRATIDNAKALSIASNFDFTQAHQQLFMNVINAYYNHEASVADYEAAEESVRNTHLLQVSAESRYAHGEATIVDVTLARSNAANAVFQQDQKRTSEHSSRYALLQAMGLPPDTNLSVVSSRDTHLPQQIPGDVSRLMRASLERRPDILSDLYKMDAAAAATRAAQKAMLPKLQLSANVEAYIAEQKVYGYTQSAPASRVAQPNGTVAVQLSWPLFQGGSLQNQLRQAQSRERTQRATLDKDILAAEQQVANARDSLGTSLSSVHSAAMARDSAQTAFKAASASYAAGVGNLTDATQAQAQLAQATSAYAVSHAQALMNAAALAYATGALTSAAGMETFGDDNNYVFSPGV
ncbi:TolC family protein [Acetobacter sp. AN02]|uniref:TolC family protein n=1 Tax=Acetobacter sp. AN02 TaxID=2894186 RepID=UPI0024344EA1|nr:TolC family protein [Acetobacter sp. AN02]MDG6095605.1 TolC family protein [Acetobacter sp. AN02]